MPFLHRPYAHITRAAPAAPAASPVPPNPWLQQAVAWANGKTVFASLHTPVVRLRRPRAKTISLSAALTH